MDHGLHIDSPIYNSNKWRIIWEDNREEGTLTRGSCFTTTVCYMYGISYKNIEDGVVLLFCKGDFHAVMLMLRGLKTFSEASGLTTNVGKSNIFSANMNMQHLKDLCEITGYQKGKLSFRYLGVLITSRKISVVDCEMLVDKLTVKVRGWGSRTLSYAGRVQLINSVLLHTHVYWASIFILPRAVLNRITSICRNYLWDGKVDTNRVPLIAWDFICRSKKEGGLGVTDCVSWSDAAIGKCIWNIAQKTYNLRFSKACIIEILQWLRIRLQNMELEGLWKIVARSVKGRLRKHFVLAIMAAMIYDIWKGRNEALWQSKVPRPQSLCNQVKDECIH
ncbi:uncharacterized protein LOC107792115 [Nicotiana tabacum]|uniref:Uncharacterized protein LOC107792115 n=1 Tax=Nicotiana tabacum TaxID=4097 RepID=A0AC58SIC9_TOBAC